jgi:hypothetical protein
MVMKEHHMLFQMYENPNRSPFSSSAGISAALKMKALTITESMRKILMTIIGLSLSSALIAN